MDEGLFAEFLLGIKEMVQEVGPRLDPDEDWPGAVVSADLSQMKEGEKLPLTVSQLPAQAFRNEESKDMLARVVIPLFVRKTNADMAAFLSTAWVSGNTAEADDQDPETVARFQKFFAEHGRAPQNYEELRALGVKPPSESDDRRECVTVIARASDGDSVLSVGFIKRRRKKAPVIERWDDILVQARGGSPGRPLRRSARSGLLPTAAR